MYKPNASLAAVLAELIVTDNLLDGAQLMLLAAPPELLPTMVTADLEELAATGYARLTPATPAAAVDGDNLPYISYAPINVTLTDAGDLPVTIYGAAWIDDGGNLLDVSLLAEPVTVSYASQVIHVQPEFRFSREAGNEIDIHVE